jgi:hypothetical protein
MARRKLKPAPTEAAAASAPPQPSVEAGGTTAPEATPSQPARPATWVQRFTTATDATVGAALLEDRRFKQLLIRFATKPPAEILDRVKADGFRWSAPDTAWTRSIDRDAPARSRLAAEQLFQAVCEQLKAVTGSTQAR